MKTESKRIYVAGAYSSDNVISVLDNIREGMRLGTEVLLAGYAPFVPWLDFHFQLMLRENEKLEVSHYYNYSMAWLKASHAVLVGTWPECDKSVGTKNEIARAMIIPIPVFWSLEELKEKMPI